MPETPIRRFALLPEFQPWPEPAVQLIIPDLPPGEHLVWVYQPSEPVPAELFEHLYIDGWTT